MAGLSLADNLLEGTLPASWSECSSVSFFLPWHHLLCYCAAKLWAQPAFDGAASAEYSVAQRVAGVQIALQSFCCTLAGVRCPK